MVRHGPAKPRNRVRFPASPQIIGDYIVYVTVNDRQVLELEVFSDTIDPFDKDANFKHEMALYSHVDPMKTLHGLSKAIGVSEGAIARYVLAKWASEGAGGILEVGPHMIKKLHKICCEAEDSADDAKRLAAFSQLRQMISWLNYPLEHPEVYED